MLQGMNILRFQERHQNNNNIDNNETPKSCPSLKNSLKIKKKKKDSKCLKFSRSLLSIRRNRYLST